MSHWIAIMKQTDYTENNPLVISNPKIEALEDARKLFLDALDEFAKQKQLEPNEIKELKEILQNVYLSKKLHYLLEYKIGIFSDYLNFATNFALQESPIEKPFTNVFYLRHTKQLLTNKHAKYSVINEQY